MTDIFGERSLAAVAREAFEELQSDCTHQDLVDLTKRRVTLAEYETWSTRAFRTDVVRAIKRPVSQAGTEAVYGDGENVKALRLFSVAEFEQKALELARQSKASIEAIRQIAAVCMEIHGKTFDVDAVIERAA